MKILTFAPPLSTNSAELINSHNSSTSSHTHKTQQPSIVSIEQRNTNKNQNVACLECRSKKTKCNKDFPSCSRCKRKGINCVYVEHRKSGPKPKPKSTPKSKKKRSKSSSSGLIAKKPKSRFSRSRSLSISTFKKPPTIQAESLKEVPSSTVVTIRSRNSSKPNLKSASITHIQQSSKDITSSQDDKKSDIDHDDDPSIFTVADLIEFGLKSSTATTATESNQAADCASAASTTTTTSVTTATSTSMEDYRWDFLSPKDHNNEISLSPLSTEFSGGCGEVEQSDILESELGLAEFDLTVADVIKLQNHWFDNCRLMFNCSV
ncbi:unnamed protein product [Ambrosiozyma monospora]|uniref:Unnamed protein product n=1 Tax=Ambrosiozyma monospora TaxID=43982 RepID=A0ACB5T0V7_AMBMO|nr:unnamed protein product [Ambrosiozyma monospora]